MLKRKVYTFLSMQPGLKWLLIKAVVISAIVKFSLMFLPFKYIVRWLGHPNKESSMEKDPDSFEIRKQVQTVIGICNRYVLWRNECYTQALTCKILLTKFLVSSTIYIGFDKNIEGKIKGHAWLRSHDTILTGNKGICDFTVHSFFS